MKRFSTALKLSFFLCFLLAGIATTTAQTLYWVNGSGSWSESSHWSLSSGGAGGAGVPTLSNDVVFDKKSFTQNSAEVAINAPAFCNNLTWKGTEKVKPILDGSKDATLIISGSLLLNDKIDNRFTGNILFTSGRNNEISSKVKLQSNLAFFGKNGVWNLTSSINTTGNLVINEGSLVSNANHHTYNKLIGITSIGKPSEQLRNNASPKRVVSSYTITKTPVSCNGGSDGKVQVSVIGGTPLYTYKLLTFGLSIICEIGPTALTSVELIGVIKKGSYYVFISDESGDDPLLITTIITEPAVLNLSVTAKDITCSGANDGKIVATATGGNTDYTYTLKKGGIIVGVPHTINGPYTFTGLVAGNNYTVEMNDAKNCGPIIQGPFTITDPVALGGSNNSKIDILCFGQSTGSMTASATIGTGTSPYEFSIDGGVYQPSGTFNGLAAGSHTITIRDASLCTVTLPTVTLIQPAAALAATNTFTAVKCKGGNDGTITSTATGGTGLFTYKINGAVLPDIGPQAGPATFSGLLAGDYTITVTDGNGCIFNTTTTKVTEPASGLGATTAAVAVLCKGGNNGSITVTATGGTANFTYTISPAVKPAIGPIPGAATFSGLLAGDYTVTITDANGCVYTTPTISVTEPAAALTATNTITGVKCKGGSDGTLTATAAGGTSPYTYKINGVVKPDIGPIPGAATFIGLAVGNYTVTVTDAKGCVFTTASTAVTEPLAALSGTSTLTPVKCKGGSDGTITVTATGGTANYTYTISPAVKPAIGPIPGAATFSGLIIGSYTITITDVNGCTFTTPAILITEPLTALSSSNTATNVKCKGGSDGTLTSTATGGTAPYTYKINNIVKPDIGPQAGAATFIGLPVGSYTVTVTDANGCTFTTPATPITEPAAGVSATNTTTAVKCKGGSDGTLTSTAIGGTAPYTYKINGIVKPDIGPQAGPATFSGLPAGSYTVTITDAAGCTFTTPATPVTEPAIGVSATNTSTAVKCKGGSDGTITATAVGGTANYTYTITPAIKPAIGPIGGPATFTNLPIGSYTITVTDAAGCTFTTPATVITEPIASLGATTTSANVKCNGGSDGSITATATGGTANYSYAISPAVKPGIGPIAGSALFSNIPAGSYTVTITDANGCTFTTPTIVITQPVLVLSATNTSTNVKCNGGNDGTLTSTATGGTTPYTYKINGAVMPDIGPQVGAALFTGLIAGDYTITITDANGCTFTTATTTITQPIASLTGSVSTQTNLTCNGGNDGAVTVTASGGTAPYTYNIDGGVFGPLATFTNLSGTAHTVTVKDANGCTFNIPVTLTQPAAINITGEVVVNVTGCFGNLNGSITITANGGSGALTYSINGGTSFQATGSFPSIGAGTYQVVVKDASGCTKNGSLLTVTQPTQVTFTYTTKDLTCNGSLNGEIHFTASGGTPPYKYSILGGTPTSWKASPDTIGLAAGTYSLKVKDANGCTTVATIAKILQPAAIGTDGGTWQDVTTCNGANTGSISVKVTGGIPPFTFSINGGTTWQPTGDFLNLFAGTYTVIVKDGNGCTINVGPNTINEPSSIKITAEIVEDVTVCWYNTNGSIVVLATGGTGDLQFSIDGGTTWQPDGFFDNLGIGIYQVAVKDENGCIKNGSLLTVAGPPAIVIDPTTTVTDITCSGANDGQVNVVATGGTVTLPSTLMYSLDGGAAQNNGAFINLTPGPHTVTVTDDNSCAIDYDFTIVEPATIVIDSQTFTNITCNGLNDGTITVTASGGTPPLSYSVDNGATYPNNDGIFTTLIPGTYIVNVKDSKGCSVVGNTYTITDPAPITITSENSTNSGCFGSNSGTITVVAAGGSAPLSYTLMNGAVIVTTNATGAFTNVVAGTYTVDVTDANGCGPAVSGPFTITEATEITYTVAQTDLLCNGSATGSNITITITGGGVAPYAYLFDGGAVIPTVSPDTKIATATDLAGGDHTITITDFAGCDSTFTVTLVEPTLLTITPTGTNPLCSSAPWTGKITATSTGGTFSGGNPKLYQLVRTSPTPWTSAWTTTPSFSNLEPGDYTITVQDKNGCEASASLTLVAPLPITVDLPVTVDPTCTDLGSITVVAHGGTGAYTFTLSPGGATITDVSQAVFTGLGANTYTVSATDANSCAAAVTAPIVLTSPSTLIITNVVITDVAPCFGGTNGSLDIQVAGATGTVIYSIDGGATWGNSNIFTDRPAGTYSIQVNDDNSCITGIVVAINEPAQIVITVDQLIQPTPALSDGEIHVSAVGGTGLLTFVLNPGAVSNTTGIFTGLPAGLYSVTVTDANGCTSTLEIGLSDFTADITSTDVTCNGANDGTITITVGGTANFDVTWTKDGVPYDTEMNAKYDGNGYTNLEPGVYGATFTDNISGKVLGPLFTTIIEPAAFIITDVVVPPKSQCGGKTQGSITVRMYDPTGNAYLYSIDDGITFVADSVFTSLPTGSYNVWVKSVATGCTSVWPANPVVLPDYSDVPDLIVLTQDATSVTTVVCPDDKTASVTYTATGGVAPYTFSWKQWITALTYYDYPNGSNLGKGTYEVTVTDANSCSLTETFTVTGPDDWRITPVYDSVVCRNIAYMANQQVGIAKLGKITVTAGGANPGYVYSWQRISDDELNLPPFQSLDNTAWDLFPSTNYFNNIYYKVTVTDSKSCMFSQSFILPYKVHIKSEIVSQRMIDMEEIWESDTACYQGKLMLWLDTLSANRNFDNLNSWWSNSKNFGSHFISSNDTINPVFADTTYIKAIVEKTVDGETCQDWDTLKVNLYPRIGIKVIKDEKFEQFQDESTLVLPLDVSYTLWSTITTNNKNVIYSWGDPANFIPSIFTPSDRNETSIRIPNGYPLIPPGANDKRFSTTIFAIGTDTVNNCIDTMRVKVKVLKTINIPNAFSPNGDGINDTWAIWDVTGVPINFLFPNMEVEVFNRWGSMVFYSKGYNKPWDGKALNGGDLPVGTYYFVIRYNKDGFPNEVGSVTILR